MQLVLNSQEIVNRVNNGNSFSKEEIVAYREQIKAARLAKRERLANLDDSGILAVVAEMHRLGFVLSDTKAIDGKRTEKRTMTWTRKSELSEAERLRNQIAKLQAKLDRVA